MPELPEVETIRRGLEPLLQKQAIKDVSVRRADLRWPIPKADLLKNLPGQSIRGVFRRGKYLLLPIGSGTLILHLGMSGVLRHHEKHIPYIKHDHFDIALENGCHLRLNDPRRFGAILWTDQDPATHPLIAPLGPEPLEEQLNADYLFERSRKRKGGVKNFIMDSHLVVGVGNIYAAESLFQAKIHPMQAAGSLKKADYKRLVTAIKKTLAASIKQGGTTLKDYRGSDGKPGYFQQSLNVYGRAGQGCSVCGTTIDQLRSGGRATAFCPGCQVLGL